LVVAVGFLVGMGYEAVMVVTKAVAVVVVVMRVVLVGTEAALGSAATREVNMATAVVTAVA
jgi:hypothetical protein